MPQKQLLQELLSNKVESIITGIAAEPFDDTWLGRCIDSECVDDLMSLESRYRINPAGEGGEIESFVLNAPLFHKSVRIIESKKYYSNFSGRLEIKKALLI